MEHIIDRHASTLVVGLILVSRWGYEQNCADFYIVTEVKGQFVTVVGIEAPEKPTSQWFGVKYPTFPVVVKGRPIRRKLRGAYIRVSSYSVAMPWDGRPEDVDHSR